MVRRRQESKTPDAGGKTNGRTAESGSREMARGAAGKRRERLGGRCPSHGVTGQAGEGERESMNMGFLDYDDVGYDVHPSVLGPQGRAGEGEGRTEQKTTHGKPRQRDDGFHRRPMRALDEKQEAAGQRKREAGEPQMAWIGKKRIPGTSLLVAASPTRYDDGSTRWAGNTIPGGVPIA